MIAANKKDSIISDSSSMGINQPVISWLVLEIGNQSCKVKFGFKESKNIHLKMGIPKIVYFLLFSKFGEL